ncbi:hypothetical protein, partial [Halobacteriovorax sp. DA5]|uniref:hypothetical protein n=1 Tax=Halobacteriovorax sp. DA5 TaxID=2067553 RepID=UPI001E4BC16D
RLGMDSVNPLRSEMRNQQWIVKFTKLRTSLIQCNTLLSQRETVNSMATHLTTIQNINQGIFTPIAQNMQGMATRKKRLIRRVVQNMQAMTTRTKRLTKGAVQNMQAMTTRTKRLTKGAVQNMQAMTTRTKRLTKGAVQNIHTTVQKALQGFQNQRLRGAMNFHAMAL